MDSYDVKLLRVLQENNRTTADQLSEYVGLSPSACQRRIKRLREDGVIERDVSVLSPKAIGRNLTVAVSVTIEGAHPEVMDEFKRSMRETPEVMMCFFLTGQTDFLLVLTVRDIEAYDDFTRRFFIENPNIKRFETSVVMDRVKVGLGMPIELEFDNEQPN